MSSTWTFILLPLLAVLFCCFSATEVNGVEFVLKRYGRRISPNSVIDINRVGREYSYSWYRYYTQYTNEGPLVCRTDNPRCCRIEDDPFDNEENGEWYYPNGQVVGSSQLYGSFYVTRGRQELSLHNYYANSPTGVYCCDIQSVNGSGNVTASYVSPTNYSYVNSSTTECVGLYSSYQLRLCRDLSISNGWVTYDSPYIPGRIATVECNNRYGLIGQKQLTCTHSGWSAPPPRCVYDCGPLTIPKNGRVETPSGTTAGSIASYSCNEGYRLIGPSTRYCQRNYMYYYYYSNQYSWSGNAPYCVDSAKIQLKFSPSTNCLEWDTFTASKIESALKGAIVNHLIDFEHENSPLSNVSIGNIMPGFFSCRLSHTETTYRTTIVGLADVSAHTLVRAIQRWVSSSPSVQVLWYLVDINPRCPVAISVESEPECGGPHPKVLECVHTCYRLGTKYGK